MTRDPELKALPSGSTLAEFGIAWNTKSKGEDKSHFMECVAWGKTGDLIVEYLSKGEQFFISSADITFEQWEKEGVKQSKHKLTVYNIQFIGGQKND